MEIDVGKEVGMDVLLHIRVLVIKMLQVQNIEIIKHVIVEDVL